MNISIQTVRSVPRGVDAIGIPVSASGAVDRELGLKREDLMAHGFDGKIGQTLTIPRASGPTLVAVGIGDANKARPSHVRDAAAALARATTRFAHVSTSLVDATRVDARQAARNVVEGFTLASYRYTDLKTATKNGKSLTTSLSLVTSSARAQSADSGVRMGMVTSEAAYLARDLANTPPAHLTARMLADRAVAVAETCGLGIEVFDRDKLEVMGLGGLLGVNRGSTEPPRMVRLTYSPRNATGHLVMVGKGVTYDSGGISLKASDAMHANMKMDMTGAASVLSALSALPSLKCRSKVTGYLMCTDNRPSGSALAMGDVLTFRNGKTAEIHNTDAEGRLILADGLCLATEQRPDAIVDIATLTGACMAALGPKIAGVLGTNQSLIDQVRDASESSGEPVWQLPLVPEYRKFLDSNVADMKNIGGPYGGAITAALFLSEFVGTVPWAHLDIAGPMNVDADDGWLSRGATGFGARLLIDLALGFTKPKR